MRRTKKKARRKAPTRAPARRKKKVTRKQAPRKKPKSLFDGFCVAVGDRIMGIDPINGAELLEAPPLDRVEKFESLGAARAWLKDQADRHPATDESAVTFPLGQAVAKPIKTFFTFIYEVDEKENGGWGVNAKIAWKEPAQKYPTLSTVLANYRQEINGDIAGAGDRLRAAEKEKKEQFKVIEETTGKALKEAQKRVVELQRERDRFDVFRAKILKK